MTTSWKARLSRLDTSVDREFSEALAVKPMVKGTYGMNPDPNRPTFDCYGLLTSDAALVDLGGRGGEWNVLLPGGKVTAEIRHEQIPAGTVLKPSDRIVATDRPGAPVFEIASIDRHRLGRWRLSLTQI